MSSNIARSYLLAVIILGILVHGYLLSAQTGNLTVNVIDEGTGAAIPGSTVSIRGEIEKSIAAETGTAVFKDLPGGRYSVTVAAQGYKSKSATINMDLSVKNEFTGTFKLGKGAPDSTATCSIAVTVLDDSESSPIPEATVSVTGPVPQNASAQDGKAKLSGFTDGTYNITVESPGYESKSGKISISSADKTEYSGIFRLKRTAAVPARKEFRTEPKTKEIPATVAKPIPSEKPDITEKPAVPAPANAEERTPEDKKPAAARKDEPIPAGQDSEQQSTEVKKPIFGGLRAPSWKTVLIAFSAFTGFISFVLFITLLARWRKSGKGGKIFLLSGTLGCGCLTFIILAGLIAFILFHRFGGKPATEEQYPEYKEPDAAPETLSKSSYSAASAMLIESFNDPKSPEKRSAAIDLLAQAVEENPGNDAYLVDLADTYALCNDMYAVRVAADIYEDVLARRPNDEAILARAADAYMQLDEFDKAYSFIKRRLTLPKSDLYAAALQIALICGETNNFDIGIARLGEILSKHPACNDVRMLLAAMQIQNGLTEMAMANLDDVISKLPKDNPLSIQAAKMRKGLGK